MTARKLHISYAFRCRLVSKRNCNPAYTHILKQALITYIVIQTSVTREV